MKLPSRVSKKASPFFDLDRRLTAYALAAGAAGVGMLALAQPAAGKIVYTKAHKVINPNSLVHLDLNHDGIADFDFTDTYHTVRTFSALGQLIVGGHQRGNSIRGHDVAGEAYASALSANMQVGPKRQFLSGGLMAETYYEGGRRRRALPIMGSGPWADVKNRYLGLKFEIKGKTHFGWARLNVSLDNTHVTATLTGYAYETIPNRPILTGKESGPDEADGATQALGASATLGQLARGANRAHGR